MPPGQTDSQADKHSGSVDQIGLGQSPAPATPSSIHPSLPLRKFAESLERVYEITLARVYIVGGRVCELRAA